MDPITVTLTPVMAGKHSIAIYETDGDELVAIARAPRDVTVGDWSEADRPAWFARLVGDHIDEVARNYATSELWRCVDGEAESILKKEGVAEKKSGGYTLKQLKTKKVEAFTALMERGEWSSDRWFACYEERIASIVSGEYFTESRRGGTGKILRVEDYFETTAIAYLTTALQKAGRAVPKKAELTRAAYQWLAGGDSVAKGNHEAAVKWMADAQAQYDAAQAAIDGLDIEGVEL